MVSDVAAKEIKLLLEDRLAAMKSKDADRAISCLADDVVAFELGPPLALSPGRARDVEAFAAWLDGFDDVGIEMRDLKVVADEQLGFAHALHHLTGTRLDGRTVSLWLRSTMCFRREGRGWRIAHAHTSVPMHMDGSFRAAVDLQP